MALPATPSQTVGPFYAIGLCRSPQDELVPPSDAGAVTLTGRLLDGEGDPIDGMIEIWDGLARRWGRSGTDAEGRFSLVVAKPGAADREAPHLDVVVFARGLLKHQLTRIYFPGEADAFDPTLVAEQENGALRFDIRLQGDRETVFFAH